MRKFEIAPIHGSICYIYSADERGYNVQYILNDGTIVGNPISPTAEALAKYYFASREEAEIALIAAKIRGDAL